MRKYQMLLVLAFVCACVYATDSTTPQPERRHRTAKYVRNLPEFPQAEQRLQSLESPMYNFIDPYGPGTYAFGFEVEDPQTGNVQFRDEEKLKNGTVRGSYGYQQPDGSVIITNFVADDQGYRAKTEIRRANGQTVASFPTQMPAQDRYFPPYDQQQAGSTNNPAIVAALQQQQHINLNPTYNPILDPGVIDPQYAAAIMAHIRDQQYSYGQGLVQYPYGIRAPQPSAPFPAPHSHTPGRPHSSAPLYDAPGAGGNPFVNFANQFPASLSPYNLYQNLQSAFPQVLPQQNPLDQLASSVQGSFSQNGPFGNFINNAQSSFQQLLPAGPSGNPFGSWFGQQNRYPAGPIAYYGTPLQQQQQQQQQQQAQIVYQPQQILSSNRPTNILGDMPMSGGAGPMMSPMQQYGAHYGPTTTRRTNKLTRPTKKRNKLKTRDGLEWFDDFLENRKRQVMYNAANVATTPATVTETTLKEESEE